jgi:hypothetical protein
MDSNPLELAYAWQALLLAGIVMGLTQFIKTVIDVRMGKERRKKTPWISQVLLPALNPTLGFLGAMLIPARPEILITYVAAHCPELWQELLVFGSWGAMVGQFGDYIFSKAKDAFQGFKNKDE